jgi:hypothetical protein
MVAVTATLSAMKTSTAGAFPVDTVTSNATAPQDMTQAHWNGGVFFAGAALGIFGAAVANSYYYGPYYYHSGYAYAPYYPAYYYLGYPKHQYRYWGYPRYHYYGYWGYPRYRYGYWGHRCCW